MQTSILTSQKLVVIFVISTSITEKKKELARIPCIRNPITFKDQTKALLDSESEVNAISQVFVN